MQQRRGRHRGGYQSILQASCGRECAGRNTNIPFCGHQLRLSSPHSVRTNSCIIDSYFIELLLDEARVLFARESATLVVKPNYRLSRSVYVQLMSPMCQWVHIPYYQEYYWLFFNQWG